jgi:Ca2+-binding EF-hand superfamily protein
MKLISYLAIAAFAVGVASPAALAQQLAQTPEQRAARFVELDTDKDGKLTKAEFVKALPEQALPFADQVWANFDPNNKGDVTKEEFIAAPLLQRPG